MYQNHVTTDRVDEDDIGVVNLPQHLLNTSLRTSSSVDTRICCTSSNALTLSTSNYMSAMHICHKFSFSQ